MSLDSYDPDLTLDTLKYYSKLEHWSQRMDVQKKHLCLVGDVALAVRKIRLNNNIRIAVHPEAHISSFEDSGLILSRNRYRLLGVTNKKLIENGKYSDEISGWKVARPELEYTYKQLRKSERDVADLKLLDRYRRQAQHWNPNLVTYGTPSSVVDILRHANKTSFSAFPFLLRDYAANSERKHLEKVAKSLCETAQKYQLTGLSDVSRLSSLTIRLLRKATSVGISRSPVSMNKKIQIEDILDKGVRLQCPIFELLQSQYHQSKFLRFDSILSLLLLEEDISRNKLTRFGSDDINEIINSIGPEENQASIENTPIRVNSELQVLDPARLAIALGQSIRTVPIKLVPGIQPTYCDDLWLRSNLSSSDLRHRLITRLNKILRENGILFNIFIWPPGQQFISTISEMVNKYGEVYSNKKVKLDPEEFREFVFQLYMTETEFKQTGPNKENIRSKIEFLLEYGNTVRIFRVRFFNSNIEDKSSKIASEIKNKIRQQCQPELPIGTAYMNPIIHSTDNPVHNILTNEVISQYAADQIEDWAKI